MTTLRRSVRFGRRLVAIFLFVYWAGIGAASPPESYGFEPGQQATYQVEIRIEEQGQARVHDGEITYWVDSVRDGRAKMRCQGMVRSRPQNRPANGPGGPQPGQPGFGAFPAMSLSVVNGIGRFEIDRRGRVTAEQIASSQLPFLLGPMHGLAVVPLPEPGQIEWETASETTIKVGTMLSRPEAPGPGGFAPPFMSPFRAQGVTFEDALTVAETTRYAAPADSAEVKRTYSLVSKEPDGAKPRLETRSSGSVTFAADGFLPEKIEWSGEAVWRVVEDERKVPFAVSVRRFTPADLDARRDKAASAAAEKEQRVQEELAGVIDGLRSDSTRKIEAAVSKLNTLRSDVPNPVVAAELQKLLETADPSVRLEVAQAAVRWATPAQSDLIVAQIDSPDRRARHDAMEAAAKLRIEKAIPALAARLAGTNSDTFKAREALASFGAAAEPAVVKMLKHDDGDVRGEAAQVLQQIGTGASLDELRKASTEADAKDRGTFDRAIRSIMGRMQRPIA